MARWGIIALTAFLALGAKAYAQTSERNFDLDGKSDRQIRALEAGSPGDRNGFDLTLSMPLLWTNVATSIGTDELVNRNPDWHFTPDLALKWSRQFDWVKVTLGGDVIFDRYFKETGASEDTLIGTAKLAFTDGRSDLFVPYFRYDGHADFSPTFSRRDDTLHDLMVGFTSGTGFGQNREVIPYRDASDPGQSYLRFDARVGRRIGDPSDFTNTFFSISLTAGYYVNNELEVAITPVFKARWYDDFFGAFRRDLRPGAFLLASWTPGWLTKALPGSVIDFKVDFERWYSTLPENNFKEWELGPVVTFRKKF